MSIIASFFGLIVTILEARNGERISSAGIWGSTLGYVSSVSCSKNTENQLQSLCYFATKPNTNRIPIMRAHISMVILNGLLAAGAISVIIVYYEASSGNLTNIMHLIEVCG